MSNRKERRSGQSSPPPATVAQLQQIYVQSVRERNYVRAFRACCECILRAPQQDIYKLYMTSILGEIDIKIFRPPVKQALLLCLKCDKINHQKLASGWLKYLLLDPVHKTLADLMNVSTFEEFDAAADWTKLQVSLQDEFLYQGIRVAAAPNISLEILMTRLRRWILGKLTKDQCLKNRHLPFLCAMAEDCYIREYTYVQTEEEATAIDALKEEIENGETDPLKIVMVATYMPLHTLTNAKNLPENIKNPIVGPVLKQQIQNPLEEEASKRNIPALDEIKDETSGKVRSMYEENPYPRWRHFNISPNPARDVEADALVAGCGTCQSATQLALQFPNVDIVAVDISRSSMAYGMRRSRELGVDNISFMHGDILSLDKLDRTFDMIDCSGVLHHMKDPVAGWKKLIPRLKPGGRMNIGLYSTSARKTITLAREYVKEHGFSPDADGIRAFRVHVTELPQDHPLKGLFAHKDFYTLSECRDLIFHVQEKTYTLPEIGETLEALDLSFLGFMPAGPKIPHIYKEKFPDDPDMTNLANWDKMEKEHPKLFIGMYQFFCCRKGEEDSPSPGFAAMKETGFLIR